MHQDSSFIATHNVVFSLPRQTKLVVWPHQCFVSPRLAPARPVGSVMTVPVELAREEQAHG